MKIVENLILQHIKSLQSYIKDIDLDIDNLEKLADAFKITLRVNEMKQLQKFVSTDLHPEILETNCLFETKTKKTLENIGGFLKKWTNYLTFKKAEESFIEKWKHNESKNGEFKQAEEKFREKWDIQDDQMLSFNNVEKSLRYLRTCKDLKLPFDDYSELLHKLEDVIVRYRLLVQNEMTNCFNAVVNFNNGNREDLFKNAQKLSSRLEEINEAREKFHEFYARFDNEEKILEEWIKKLALNLVELSDTITKLGVAKQNQELNNKLLIVKALSYLDGFLSNEKYIEVYRNYQGIFFAETPNTLKTIIDAIRSHDYTFVFNEISKMENINDTINKRNLSHCKKILNDSIENLIEETQSLTRLILIGDNAIPPRFQAIVENTRKIQNAKAIISHFVDNQDKLTECVKKVQKTISSSLLELCQTVRGLINSYNFCEVDIQRRNLISICNILDTYCDQPVIDAIQGLERIEQKTCEQFVKAYSKMDLNGYLMNPPKDVFEKFSKISSEKMAYNQALSTIKEKIFETFRKELAKAKEHKFQDGSNPYIRNYESALNCLPDSFKLPLTLELNCCKDEINQLEKDHESELQFIISRANFNQKKNFIEKCQRLGSISSIKKILSEIKGKVNKAIDHGNIPEALSNAKQLFEFKTQLGSGRTEIDLVYSEVKEILVRNFEGIFSSFLQRFFNFGDIYPSFWQGLLQDKITTITDESVQITEKDFCCLLDYIRFRKENKSLSIVNELFPNDFNAKLIELNAKIYDYFK